MNKNGAIILVVIILLIIIAIVGYTSYSSPVVAPVDDTTTTGIVPGNTNDGGVVIENSTTTSTTTVTTPPVKTFTVTGSNFAFSPSTLTVNKGDKVVINFVNSGGTHDFKIDEFGVATAQINGGQSQTVSFTADKTGTFEYYCSVGTHRQMGMVGTLTVK